MSAVTLWHALEARLKTIPGLTNIMLGEPPTIQEAPALLVAYGGQEGILRSDPPARNINGTSHVFALRLAIKWQDNPQAEMQLITLIDLIPAAVDTHLGNTLSKGHARVSGAVTGFAEYGKEKFRVADYTCTILEKQEAS